MSNRTEKVRSSVAKRRAEGWTDIEIRVRMRQTGWSDDQIDVVMVQTADVTADVALPVWLERRSEGDGPGNVILPEYDLQEEAQRVASGDPIASPVQDEFGVILERVGEDSHTWWQRVTQGQPPQFQTIHVARDYLHIPPHNKLRWRAMHGCSLVQQSGKLKGVFVPEVIDEYRFSPRSGTWRGPIRNDGANESQSWDLGEALFMGLVFGPMGIGAWAMNNLKTNLDATEHHSEDLMIFDKDHKLIGRLPLRVEDHRFGEFQLQRHDEVVRLVARACMESVRDLDSNC